MRNKYILLILIIGFLTGCGREPMIQLNETNQAIVDEKRQQETEVPPTETGTDDMAEDEEIQTPSPVTSQIDTSQWTVAENAFDAQIMDYLPVPAYQVKEFQFGEDIATQYATHIYTDTQWIQVMLRQGTTSEVSLYNWGSRQIVKVDTLDAVNPYINHLRLGDYSTDAMELELQLPFELGATWERDANTMSEITGLFQEATLPSGTYQDVVEVTHRLQDGSREWQMYYAREVGWIATREGDQVQYVTGSYPESRTMSEITFYQSQAPEQGAQLVPQAKNFKWQTNWTLAQAWQDFFRDAGVIDESIQVQNVEVINGVVHFDVSSGIVALLNRGPATEEAMIGSMVVTLGEFFGVDQVRITVNSNGMLPQTVPYPTNGMYNLAMFDTLRSPDTTASEENYESPTGDLQSQEESDISGETIELDLNTTSEE